MFKSLNPGVIGVTTSNLEEGLRAAEVGGFDGLEINPDEIADRAEKEGIEAIKAKFQEAGIRPAAWGLPNGWRGDDAQYAQMIQELPRLAKASSAIGCTRLFTWILPGSNEKTLDENHRWHLSRLKPAVQILGDYGCSFGLEYIGPKTSRESSKHMFYYKLKTMLALAREIGPNAGLMLDSWHWHTAHETVSDLENLKPTDVVHVHVNDAPAGIETDSQIDSQREIPGATGVIDIAGFLKTLNRIGYDGPVTPEPFNKGLHELPSDEARLKLVGESMKKIWSMAGL
ncbi:MAG TPA: sugar phosphate isomerase/epimerase family protein [Fimbriimonas sp.]|nr:sugar phosphate isomerase/epimerase family protein [Fimbriimonas sp.]